MKEKELEFKGTKGPWYACCKKSKPHFLFANETEITICGFYQKQDDGTELPLEEVQANARLIESAPELLEALQTLKEYCVFHKISLGSGVIQKIDEAIEKALK